MNKKNDLMAGLNWAISYKGFLGQVTRYFATKERAIQWARQVGKYQEITIKQLT